MTAKRICRDFIKNPKEDPLDGHRLNPGMGPYRGYVALCAENDFDVDYMLDEDFIASLSSRRTASPTRSPRSASVVSPRNISIPRSPKSSSLRSPLRSQPMLPNRSFEDERSVGSAIRPDDLPTRSFSDRRLNSVTPQITPQTTQTLYPKVVGPSRVSTPTTVAPSRAPTPSYTEEFELIGTETFDPDPVTTITETPQTSARKAVRGPYGSQGENVVVSGVHKLPGQRVYSTADIPEHEVRSVHNGYNTLPIVPRSNVGQPIVPRSNTSMINNMSIANNVRSMASTPIVTRPIGPSIVTRPIVTPQIVTPPIVTTPIVTPPKILYPSPSYNMRSEQIGDETFDPDPITSVVEVPPIATRRAVRGPYGENGENMQVTGVHKLPGQRTFVTRDIPEHPVRSTNINRNGNGNGNSYSNIIRAASINRNGNGNGTGNGNINRNGNGASQRVPYPQPTYSEQLELIGSETFDPDPMTTVTETPQRSVRTAVNGPYGRAGENVRTTGIYKSQGRRVYSTMDIPEHEVISNDEF